LGRTGEKAGRGGRVCREVRAPPRYRQSRRPLFFQDIQADSTVRVDIAMINSSGKADFRGLEGIVRREVDIQEKYAAGIR